MSDASPLQALPSNHSWQNIECKDDSRVHNGHVYGDVYHNDVQNVYQNQRPPAERLLESLEFPGMYRYQERPLDSYEGTYEWFFDNSKVLHSCEHCIHRSSGNNGCNYDCGCEWELERQCNVASGSIETCRREATKFRSWLRTSQQEIFWVSGNAGAGKSCLMRFLLEHECTTKLLREWAGEEGSLSVVGFFFWAAGGDLEKSHIGLLRSMLHQILRQQPNLVVTLLAADTKASREGHEQPWTLSRLREALSKVLDNSSASTSFMFFIDGLDEFQGDIPDLLEALSVLNKSSNIKLCVSSRPHNVFQRAYGSRERDLRLHELNRFDIEAYVQGRLGSDFGVHGETHTDSELQTISAAIQDKAQGVFLWVYLAVKSLRRSLSDSWSLPEMLGLLDDIPPDLEDVLRRMFEEIHPAHRRHAARVFSLLLQPISREEDRRLSLVWLATMMDSERGTIIDYDHPVPPSNLLQMADTAEQAARRWCKDLIDVVRRDGGAYANDPHGYQSYIQFPHLTVKDFISTKKADGILAKLAGDDFCPAFAHCSMVAQIVRYTYPDARSFLDLAVRLMKSSIDVDDSKRVALVAMAQSFNAFGQRLRQPLPHWALEDSRFAESIGWDVINLDPVDDRTGSAVFMAFVIYLGGYKLFWLLYESTPYSITTHSRQLWLSALLAGNNIERDNTQSLSKMLQLGADPNKPVHPRNGSASVWQAYLYRCHRKYPFTAKLRVLDILLSYGTDPDTELDTSKLYRFLRSSEADGSESDGSDSTKSENGGSEYEGSEYEGSELDRSELEGLHRSDFKESESEDPGVQGPAIEKEYIPATAAFELPLPTATYRYYEYDERKRIEKWFPLIKAKLVAASEAQAQRQRQQRQNQSILELMWT